MKYHSSISKIVAAALLLAVAPMGRAQSADERTPRELEGVGIEEHLGAFVPLATVFTGEDGKPVAHVHTVLGRPDASTIGGHLLQAHVRPTLEVVLVQSPAYLRRIMNPEAGLPLIEPQA